jgi:hypothetical protein
MDVVITILWFLPLVAFLAWCLWGVDWRLAWPILTVGGWVPLVLIGIMVGVVWAFVVPSPALVFGFVYVPNLLWQLGAVALLISLALFCGWLQGQLGWYPPVVSFEPPPPVHDDHHSAH